VKARLFSPRSTLWPMLWKEFVQMRRDRLTLAMMLGLPAIQLLLFGYAIQTEVRHLPLLVLDESRSSESRALVSVLENTGNFRVVGHVADREGIRRAVERGSARAALVIPPTYAADIARHRPATAQVIVDAADPMASAAAMSGAAMAGPGLRAGLTALRPEAGRRPNLYAGFAWALLAVAVVGVIAVRAGLVSLFWLELAAALLFILFWLAQTFAELSPRDEGSDAGTAADTAGAPSPR